MFVGKVSRSLYCVVLLSLAAESFTLSVRLHSSTLGTFMMLQSFRRK